jgi:hypothetical protein
MVGALLVVPNSVDCGGVAALMVATEPYGFTSSESSTPILRSTHSMGSKPPVRMPMRGMSPPPLFFGIVRVPAGTLPVPRTRAR